MKITVAGAGAGKTSCMADRIDAISSNIGKIVFCIAFTNAAAENIRKKVIANCGKIPDNVRISTIHSFLYEEIVNPLYFLLYKKQYQGISVVKLPEQDNYKKATIRDLENESLLHISVIPERAKWVIHKKSSDNATVKECRKKYYLGFLCIAARYLSMNLRI